MWDVFGDGKLVFKYGAFITAVINFLIMRSCCSASSKP